MHLVPHKKEGGDHIEEVLISERHEIKDRAKEAIKAHTDQTRAVIEYGASQVQGVIEKMREMVERLNERQQQIVKLACSRKFPKDIEKTLEGMGNVALIMDIEKEFDSNLSKVDSERINLLKDQFESFSNDIKAGNDIIGKVYEKFGEKDEKYEELVQRMKTFEQENSTKDIKIQIANLQSTVEKNQEKCSNSSNEAVNKFKIFKESTDELTSKLSTRIQTNTQEIKQNIETKYSTSLKLCNDNYRQLEKKLFRIQKQIKEINLVVEVIVLSEAEKQEEERKQEAIREIQRTEEEKRKEDEKK